MYLFSIKKFQLLLARIAFLCLFALNTLTAHAFGVNLSRVSCLHCFCCNNFLVLSFTMFFVFRRKVDALKIVNGKLDWWH